MAPATEAVVGAVPAAKSGVASAINTVARMVARALGVAVVGSLVSSLYSKDVDGSFRALPPHAETAAEDSIGAAHAIAGQLPPDAASRLIATTGDAFTEAMGAGSAGRRHSRRRCGCPGVALSAGGGSGRRGTRVRLARRISRSRRSRLAGRRWRRCLIGTRGRRVGGARVDNQRVAGPLRASRRSTSTPRSRRFRQCDLGGSSLA